LVEGTGGGDWLTIPICVDTTENQAIDPDRMSVNILHLGTMFWPPNVEGIVWFSHEILPLVVEKIRSASLTIIGKNPPEEVLRLENRETNVSITGYIRNPRPYLEKAAVFIVPLLSGGGMRVKILDAWRWGLPIVSTRIGAEGISYQEGENILIADSAHDFAESILRVMTDAELAERLRHNGRRWVAENYEWTKTYHAWDEVYPEA
jgi:glycosyltransferase involved in cell wall biosynthesis